MLITEPETVYNSMNTSFQISPLWCQVCHIEHYVIEAEGNNSQSRVALAKTKHAPLFVFKRMFSLRFFVQEV